MVLIMDAKFKQAMAVKLFPDLENVSLILGHVLVFEWQRNHVQRVDDRILKQSLFISFSKANRVFEILDNILNLLDWQEQEHFDHVDWEL